MESLVYLGLEMFIWFTFQFDTVISACPQGSRFVGSTCYWVSISPDIAEDANDKCAMDGGGLGLIPSQTVADLINSYRSDLGDQSTEYFIGYRDTSPDGSYVQAYNGGGIQTWTNWKSGQPNSDAHQHCVTLYGSAGEWYDESCDNTYYALCSNASTLLPATTTSHETTQTDTTAIDATTTDTTTTTTDSAITTTTTDSAITTSTTDSTTATTTTTTDSTTPTTTTCYCGCNQDTTSDITANMTEAIQQLIDEIKKELTLDKSTLSSTTRKYISAEDSRPSAAAVGAVGVVFLTVIFGGLLLQDIPVLYRTVKEMMTELISKKSKKNFEE